MKRILILFIFLAIFLLIPGFIETAFSQPPPPPPEPIPLDGGLTALILGGLAYGARKLYKQQKEDETL